MSNALDGLAAVGRIVAGLGPAAARLADRMVLNGVEHETLELPVDVLRDDGSLDIYDDVKKLFQPGFSKGKLSIQCGGSLGYIPLNDRYALNIDTRVPVDNLERLISLSGGYHVQTLERYTRHFGVSRERASSLYDILADQLLGAFDLLWNEGLVRGYERVERVSSSPIGRIDPFRSALLTSKVGKPGAVSSSFVRTPDTGPNRLILAALLKLRMHYSAHPDPERGNARLMRIERSVARLEGIGHLRSADATPNAVAGYFRRLADHHEHYADALRTARIIIADLGISLRTHKGMALMPSILIDMADVFEGYVRRLLCDGIQTDGVHVVKDGNKGAPVGASTPLYTDFTARGTNPKATPDIVVLRGTAVPIVLDAKYKPAPNLPDRSEVAQVVVYGAVYNCPKVMLLYADRKEGRGHVERIGRVGRHEMFVGRIDLGAKDIEAEEESFVSNVRALLE